MKFVFACGGTAGHVYPAVAVAGSIAKRFPDSEFLFIGAEGKMEMELVPKEGYSIRAIKITNISRSLSIKGIVHNVNTVINTFSSVINAKKILKEFGPDVVIGTGGYVCYPVLTAASMLNIPTVIHESNAYPGLTTRMLAKKCSKILVGLEDAKDKYSCPEKIEVTGTPVRGVFDEFERQTAKKELGFDDRKPLILSVWGSLGSGYMNGIISEIIPEIIENEDFYLVHSVGKRYFSDFFSEDKKYSISDCEAHGVFAKEYIFDIPRYMAAADLICCRAGASTLAELAYIGKPAIIVPSPNVTANHQEKNARVLENAGAAVVLTEGSFTSAQFKEKICSLTADKSKLGSMSDAMKSLGFPDAADKITDIIIGLIKNK